MSWLVRDLDGNVRGALICWGVALGAFIVFGVPRQVVLACLFIATATVGFAAFIVDVAPGQAVASSLESQPPPARYRFAPASGDVSGGSALAN